jgi:hypothetical protein
MIRFKANFKAILLNRNIEWFEQRKRQCTLDNLFGRQIYTIQGFKNSPISDAGHSLLSMG